MIGICMLLMSHSTNLENEIDPFATVFHVHQLAKQHHFNAIMCPICNAFGVLSYYRQSLICRIDQQNKKIGQNKQI